MSDRPLKLNQEIERSLDDLFKQESDAQSSENSKKSLASNSESHSATPNSEAIESGLSFQKSVDHSIKRLFPAAEMPAALIEQLEDLTPSVASAVKPQKSARLLGMPQWSVAAILLIGIGSWVIMGIGYAFPEPDNYGERMAVAIYEKAVDKGFEPDWFCEDEKLFADTFAERQSKGVWLKPLPEGIRMAGLAYHKGLGKSTTSMLAWVDEKPVLLFVDKANAIPKRLLKDRADDEIHLFTSRLDNLMVVEVSPFDEPKISSYLFIAEPPKEPTGRVPGS